MTSPNEIVTKCDQLWKNSDYETCYNYLREALAKPEAASAEVYWRMARACRQMAVDYATDKEKTKAFTYEAFENAKKGIELDNDNWGCHKWYGILLDLTARFEGIKKRIENSYLVKEHLQKAIDRNPSDAATLHSLGVWCFEVTDLPWIQQKVAAAFFATPPTSTYEEGLKYLLEAEKVDPNFYSYNLLYLGKTYQRLKQKDEARQYLDKVVNYSGDNNDDKTAKKEAADMLKKL